MTHVEDNAAKAAALADKLVERAKALIAAAPAGTRKIEVQEWPDGLNAVAYDATTIFFARMRAMGFSSYIGVEGPAEYHVSNSEALIVLLPV
jgi:hypothetical protein